MSGTSEGARKAADTTKKKYGDKFFEDAGRKGGKKSAGARFRDDPDFAREMGRKGGLKKKSVDNA